MTSTIATTEANRQTTSTKGKIFNLSQTREPADTFVFFWLEVGKISARVKQQRQNQEKEGVTNHVA